ncbi:MAG: hypothetical protein OEV20_09215, partial [Actinomycetota bacterium]|nr:hypothetical protein [Actinomycetota bacterium]
YYVNTIGAAKQKLLGDVEKAIAEAQSIHFDPMIERDTGSWTDDGFAVGDTIRIQNSGGNDGVFVIESIDGRKITVNGALTDQGPVESAPGKDGFRIKGPGRIEYTDVTMGSFSPDFELGERIVLSGTEANDGLYLISRIVDKGTTSDGESDVIVVDSFFDLVDDDFDPVDRDSNTGIGVTANGAPVRLDPDAVSEDAEFELGLMIGGELQAVKVVVSRDGMKVGEESGERDESADSDLSNNRNLSDLVADVQNAIDEAIDAAIDAAVELDPTNEDEIRDGKPEVEVGLDGTRLVIGLKEAAQVEKGLLASEPPALEFEDAGASVVVIRQDGRDFGDDDFALAQLVLVNGAGAYDGRYVVSSVVGSRLELIPDGAVPGGAAKETFAKGVVITQTFTLAKANGVTEDILGFDTTPAPGEVEAPITANLEDFVVYTTDGESVAVVLDGTETVYDALKRINDTLAANGVLATIALNEDKTGFDVKQTAVAQVGEEPGERFRVESINDSLAALRLGILGADAKSDENEDGRIDQADGDDVIKGAPVGGTSLFDRFFIDDVIVELALEVEAVVEAEGNGEETSGIVVEGDFGFFDVSATASGDITAIVAFELQDPIPTTPGITIGDLYEAFQSFDLLTDMIDPREALSFGGATLDADGEVVTFTDEDGKGRITRERKGSWDEDRFKVDQKITVVDAQGTEEIFQIVAITDVDTGGASGQSILELDRSVGTLESGQAGDDRIRIESAIATLTLKDLQLP